MLKKVTAAFSLAAIGKKLLDFGKEAIQAASDLQEVQNVVDVTFGEQGAAAIESWAKKAGQQFGLTETQAKKFTSTLGAMMKSAGLTGDEIVNMSTDMAGLAADMASFYNLDFDTAFQKIRAGISGETEPLKQLGINMSVANLEAFALQKGLGKTFAEMSQGEQVMLRYQYMMQATADAQGDFARTSDGFANSTRMLETNLENIKTQVGNLLLPVIGEAVSGLNKMITSLTTNPGKTVLDEFAEIDLDTQRKIDEIEATAEKARTLNSVLEEIKGSSATSLEGSNLDKSVQKMANNSSEMQKGLEGFNKALEQMGENGISKDASAVSDALDKNAGATQKVAAASDQWLETCKRLVQTIPGLSTIIDTQTGEIQGGTQAVYEYIDAWQRAQTNLALINANRQKHAALSTTYAQLPGLEIDMRVAEKRVRDARKQLNDLLKKYGINETADTVSIFNPGSWAAQQYGLTDEQAEQISKEIAYYQTLRGEAIKATDAYDKQKRAYDEAVEALEEADRVLIENMTVEEKAALIVEKYSQAQDAAKAAVQEASAAMKEYRKNAIEKTTESVNKLIHGFNSIEKPKVEDMPKPDEMVRALQSQLEFMQKYQDNLNAAKKAGLDENLLAELSDGSEESARYLKTIAENPSYIEKINEKYRAVNNEKKRFAINLTDNNLAVDEAYQELSDIQKEALKVQKEIEDAMVKNAGDSVERMAAYINSKVGGLEAAINNVNYALSKVGLTSFSLGSFGLDGSFAAGLNYVPFNGFLAELHEGEGILTAEENRIWQNFKAGQRGVDYDQIGGMMRDNIKPGGNVYLDGRVVGSVISEMQGNQYRALQRSGWQG